MCFENVKYNLSSPSWMSGLIARTLSVAYEKQGNYSLSDEAPYRGRRMKTLPNESTHLGDKEFFFPLAKGDI